MASAFGICAKSRASRIPAVSAVSGIMATRMSDEATTGVEAGLAMVHLHAVDRLRPAAPAGDLEAHGAQLHGRVLAEDAHAEKADADVARLRLVPQVDPLLFALEAVVDAHPAKGHEAVHDDIFGHAGGEVGIDDAHHRHALGQPLVLEQVIDAGAEREDGVEQRQVGEGALGLFPGGAVAHGAAVEDLAGEHDLPAREHGLEALPPGFRVPGADAEKEGGHVYALSLETGARSKAAANRALV